MEWRHYEFYVGNGGTSRDMDIRFSRDVTFPFSSPIQTLISPFSPEKAEGPSVVRFLFYSYNSLYPIFTMKRDIIHS